MLPSELKLTCLGHCYVHLPEIFLSKEASLKVGSLISIRSVHNEDESSEVELIVMWNGQITSGRHAELDLDFGRANKLRDELIVLCSLHYLNPVESTSCRVELVESTDYSIISQHLDANVLDRCKLVAINQVIPIWLAQHVKVLVKVVDITPDKQIGLLTQWTEMQFQHKLDKIPVDNQETDPNQQDIPIVDPIPIVSCSLGIDYNLKFNLGSILIHGDRGCGKTHLLKSIAANYKKFNSEIFNCKQLRGKRPELVKKKLLELLTSSLDKQPSILALDDIDSFTSSDPKHDDEKGQEVIYKKRLVDALCYMFKQLERSEHVNGRKVIILTTCRSLDSLDPRLVKPGGRQYFNKIIPIGSPNFQQRLTIIKDIFAQQRQMKIEISDTEYEAVVKRCNSYMPLDLRMLVERSIISACRRSQLSFTSELLTVKVDDLLDSINEYVPTNLRGVALQTKTKKSFSDIGGMKKIKDMIMKTILLQVKYPKLYKKCPFRPQSSILLYGPPGCGKTLIAEALTNHDFINSICVRGPELLSKYIGASEAAVRNLFKRAEMAKPCVVFFDEFESLVSKRGTDSTGVTDRIVNQFLTLMDGVEKLSDGIFIIAASSRPDIIDPAILRPGRLDKHIYCPMPEQEDRLDILKVLSRNIELDDKNIDLVRWSQQLEYFSGADIQSLLYSAQLKALHEIVGPTNILTGKVGKFVGPTDSSVENKTVEGVVVNDTHLEEAFRSMKDDVKTRYFKLLNQHLPKIKQTEQVAMRVTLA